MKVGHNNVLSEENPQLILIKVLNLHWSGLKYRSESVIIEKNGKCLCNIIRNFLNYGENMKVGHNSVLSEENQQSISIKVLNLYCSGSKCRSKSKFIEKIRKVVCNFIRNNLNFAEKSVFGDENQQSIPIKVLNLHDRNQNIDQIEIYRKNRKICMQFY